MDEYVCNEHIVLHNGMKSQRFIYKQSSILYRTLNPDGRWSDETRLLENASGDYSIDIDSSGNLNLLCLNKAGELLHIVYNGTHWYSKVLAAFKGGKYRPKHLKILCWGKYMHVFFALCAEKNPRLYSIQHNFWDGSKWKNFKVIRVMGEGSIYPFYAGHDQTGTVHLVCRAPRPGLHQLFYCRFSVEYTLWSNPEGVTAITGVDSHYYALTDNRDALHLVWNEPLNNAIRIKYLQRTGISRPRGLWRNVFLISDHGADNRQPLLYVVGTTQWVVWVYKGTLFGCFSYDGGKNWTKPLRIDIPLGCPLKMYNIVKGIDEHPDVVANLAYGYEREGRIMIPVIDDVLDKERSEGKIQGISVDVDIDKGRLKEYAIEAKNYVGKLLEEVDKVDDKKKKIEGMIQNQVEKMSEVYGNLREFKEEVKELGKNLERVRSENLEITASINQWQSRFKEHRKVIEELTNKYTELLEVSKSFSEDSVIKKIVNYFKQSRG